MRILLADDHDLVRETLVAFLSNQSGITQIDESPTLEDAIEKVRKVGPYDLVLLDYNMPGMNGLTGLDKMQQQANAGPTAVISGTATPSIAREAIAAGAIGFVPKTLGSKSIVGAIRVMATGEVFAPYAFMQQPEETPDTGDLTEREVSVLAGLCDGKTNKEIARDLDLQEVTIKLHVKTLSRKLEARNRTHAAMIGRERGLV